jgi:hypothetical protein
MMKSQRGHTLHKIKFNGLLVDGRRMYSPSTQQPLALKRWGLSSLFGRPFYAAYLKPAPCYECISRHLQTPARLSPGTPAQCSVAIKSKTKAVWRWLFFENGYHKLRMGATFFSSSSRLPPIAASK